MLHKMFNIINKKNYTWFKYLLYLNDKIVFREFYKKIVYSQFPFPIPYKKPPKKRKQFKILTQTFIPSYMYVPKLNTHLRPKIFCQLFNHNISKFDSLYLIFFLRPFKHKLMADLSVVLSIIYSIKQKLRNTKKREIFYILTEHKLCELKVAIFENILYFHMYHPWNSSK